MDLEEFAQPIPETTLFVISLWVASLIAGLLNAPQYVIITSNLMSVLLWALIVWATFIIRNMLIASHLGKFVGIKKVKM
jgi:hypothetical protein